MKAHAALLVCLVPLYCAAQQPLPIAGSYVPVNVLMCRSAQAMQSVIERSYAQHSESQTYIKELKDKGECEIGGGAKVVGIENTPFLTVGARQIHLLKVIFGGKTYYTNFNRRR